MQPEEVKDWSSSHSQAQYGSEATWSHQLVFAPIGRYATGRLELQEEGEGGVTVATTWPTHKLPLLSNTTQRQTHKMPRCGGTS